MSDESNMANAVRRMRFDAELSVRKYAVLVQTGGRIGRSGCVVGAVLALALSGWAYESRSGIVVAFAALAWLGLLASVLNDRWLASSRS